MKTMRGVRAVQGGGLKWPAALGRSAGLRDRANREATAFNKAAANPVRAYPKTNIHMITPLISLLISGLVLYVIYYVIGMFIKGRMLSIIGIILGLIFLLSALRTFGVLNL